MCALARQCGPERGDNRAQPAQLITGREQILATAHGLAETERRTWYLETGSGKKADGQQSSSPAGHPAVMACWSESQTVCSSGLNDTYLRRDTQLRGCRRPPRSLVHSVNVACSPHAGTAVHGRPKARSTLCPCKTSIFNRMSKQAEAVPVGLESRPQAICRRGQGRQGAQRARRARRESGTYPAVIIYNHTIILKAVDNRQERKGSTAVQNAPPALMDFTGKTKEPGPEQRQIESLLW